MPSEHAVRAFMSLGQPELVPTGQSRPSPSNAEIAQLMQGAWSCERVSGALKEQGSTATGLGARLMVEELGETLEAMARGDLAETADGLADLIYVALWTAVAHGIPIDAVFAEVQRSNMAKFPECRLCGGNGRYFEVGNPNGQACPDCAGKGRVVLRDATGKIQKPPGWTPPNIAGVLREHEAQAVQAKAARSRADANMQRYAEEYGAGTDPHAAFSGGVNPDALTGEHQWVLREAWWVSLSTDPGTNPQSWDRWRCRACGATRNTKPGERPDEAGCIAGGMPAPMAAPWIALAAAHGFAMASRIPSPMKFVAHGQRWHLERFVSGPESGEWQLILPERDTTAMEPPYTLYSGSWPDVPGIATLEEAIGRANLRRDDVLGIARPGEGA